MSGNHSKRDQFLGKWGRWAATRWRASIAIAIGVTAIMAVGVSMVRPEFTFYSIMPTGSEKVRDLKTITETFPAASSIIVVVDGDGGARARVTSAIDALEEELRNPALSEYVAHVYGRMDMEFLTEHGLMLTDAADVRRLANANAEPGLVPFFRSLNDDLEREYAGNEASLADDEELVIAQFEALEQLLAMVETAASGEEVPADQIRTIVNRYLVGDGYLLNRDNTMGLLFIEPTFTINDVGPMVNGIPELERIIQARADELGVTTGLTGFTVVGKDEAVTAEQGLATSTTIALGLILLVIIVAFRMFSAPLICGVPLVIGVVWTIGVAGFVLRRLNIMTAMYMVALLGLGIDYAIHMLTTYRQERDAGADFADAVGAAFNKSGSGVLTGALTTAVAFLALQVGESPIVRELGVVAGSGVLCELIAMFLILPGLLGLRNHRNAKRGRAESRLLRRVSPGATLLGGLGGAIGKRPLVFALVMVAAGAAISTQASDVEIEGNIMNMEAKGLESVELQDLMVEEFSMAPDFLSVTTTSLAELRSLSEELEELSTVEMADSIIPYLPAEDETTERAREIRRLWRIVAEASVPDNVDAGSLAAEVDRLWMNIVEMADLAYFSDMDRLFATLNRIVGLDADGQKVAETPIDRLPFALESTAAGELAGFQERFAGAMRAMLLSMANPEPVTLQMIPERVRNSYVSPDGNRFLLNIIPKQNPWEPEFRSIYTTQVESVTDRATGMLLAADQMFTIARVDGVRAAIAALVVIFVLLLLDFRNPVTAIVTLLPLLLSFGALFGFMALTGIKFDFINILAVPLLIGIGIDDAVHINHRYLQEGPGTISTVVGKTGTALLLTSVTTIIGFASFIPSIMRAMRSSGIVLSLAMALAFLFSVLLHPAVLVLIREKLGIRLEPWRLRT